jgi:hypothetical protein
VRDDKNAAVCLVLLHLLPFAQLYEPDELPLAAGISIDISLGRLYGAVTGEELHVAQAASGTMDIARGDRGVPG